MFYAKYSKKKTKTSFLISILYSNIKHTQMNNQHRSQRGYKSKRKQYGGGDDDFEKIVEFTKASMAGVKWENLDTNTDNEYYAEVENLLKTNVSTKSIDFSPTIDEKMFSKAVSAAATEIVAEQVKPQLDQIPVIFGKFDYDKFKDRLKNNLWSKVSVDSSEQPMILKINKSFPEVLNSTLKEINTFDPKSLGKIMFGNFATYVNNIKDDKQKTSLEPRDLPWSPLSTGSLGSSGSPLSTGTSFSTNTGEDYDLTNLLLDPSINLKVNDFYKPGLNSFPYQFVKDKFDFEGAKLIIKNKIKEIREKHDKQISMFMDTSEDNIDILKTYITNVTKDIVLLSRVYVCVLVSEVNSQIPIKSTATQGNIENVKQNINRLKSMLLDTIPFLLKIEVDNKEV